MDLHDALEGCAWILALGIVFVSLGPESVRPHLASPHLERFGAYFVLGVLEVLAYPDAPILIVLVLVLMALGLEMIQHLLPHRHAYLPDAKDGAWGGFLGVVIGGALARLMP